MMGKNSLKVTRVILIMLLGITMISINNFQNLGNPLSAYASTSKPTVTITSPLASSNVLAGNDVVTGTTFDSTSTIKYVTVSVNGSGMVTATPKSPGNWSTWNATLLFQYPGNNILLAKMVDNAGNTKYTSIKVMVSDLTSRPSTSSTLPFTLIVRPWFSDLTELTTLYKKHANSTDIIEEFSNQTLPSSATTAISSPMKGVTFFALNDIRNNVVALHNNGYTWVIYDLEPDYSPASEVADPVGSVQAAAKMVHNNGMKLMLTPAEIPRSYVPAMTQYVDGYLIQAQGMITQPTPTFLHNISGMINLIRTENPNETIIMQGTTIYDTATQIDSAYDAAKNMLNGVTVFYYQTSDLPTIATVLTHVDGIS